MKAGFSGGAGFFLGLGTVAMEGDAGTGETWVTESGWENEKTTVGIGSRGGGEDRLTGSGKGTAAVEGGVTIAEGVVGGGDWRWTGRHKGSKVLVGSLVDVSSGTREVCSDSPCWTLVPKWLLTVGIPATRSIPPPLLFRDVNPGCVPVGVCVWVVDGAVENWMGRPLRMRASVDVS